MVLKTDEKHKLNSTIIRLEAKRKKTCTDTVFLGSEEPKTSKMKTSKMKTSKMKTSKMKTSKMKTSKMKTSKMVIGHRLFVVYGERDA